MIVDCHTHMSFPANDTDIAEHIEACEGVDRCIVLPVSRGDRTATNEELSRYVSRHEKMVGFAVINPAEDKVGLKDIKAVTTDLGLVGVVLYCASSDFHPSHSRAMLLYESAQELGLSVFFSNGAMFNRNAVLDYSQPHLLDGPARKFPNLNMIIGSMGTPFYWQTVCMLSKHENVYADLTISPRRVWEVYNMVVSCHEAGVMDKLLFGSGYPSATATECMETLLGFNKLFNDGLLRPVPREKIRNVIERDSLELLGIKT